jgi:hypothetical protein
VTAVESAGTVCEQWQCTWESSSSSVRIVRKPATIEPPDVPEMTLGNAPCSSSARTTPMWYMAREPPPDKQRAVWPNAVCADEKKWSCSNRRCEHGHT